MHRYPPGPNGEHYFIKDDPAPINQNMHASNVALPIDYAVAFDLTPTGTEVASWSNIVHFTATNHDCCNYGDRVPGVWFYPGSRRIHIIDGHVSSQAIRRCL